MARIDTLSNFLTDVSSAIKQKTGSSSPIPASSFDTEILSITTGGTYQTKSQSITTNGNYVIAPDTGYDAIEQLNLSVAIPLQQKTYTFTQNTTTTIIPEQGYAGFSQVNLEIDVQGETPDPTTATVDDVISPKTFYSNGQKLTGTIEETTIPLDPTIQKDAYNIFGDFQSKINNDKIVCYKNGTSLVIYDLKVGTSPIATITGVFASTGHITDITDCFYSGSDWKILVSYVQTDDTWPKIIEVHKQNNNYTATLIYTMPSLSSVNNVELRFFTKNNENYILYGGAGYNGYAHIYKFTYDYSSSIVVSQILNNRWDIRGNGYGCVRLADFDIGFTNNNAIIIANVSPIVSGSYGRSDYTKVFVLASANFALLKTYNMFRSNRGEFKKRIAIMENGYVVTTENSTTTSLVLKTYSIDVSNNTLLSTQTISVPYSYSNLEILGMKNGLVCVANGSAYAVITVLQFNMTNYSYSAGNWATITPTMTTNLINGRRCDTSSNLRQLVCTANEQTALFLFTEDGTKRISLRDKNAIYYNTDDANASAGNILNSKIAYGSSGKITGTMPNNGALNYTPTTSLQNIPAGYTSGGTISAVTSAIDSNIRAENIKSGVTILGIEGTYDGPGYDSNLVLDSVDAGGAEQYLGGTPITDISNVGGFDVFNTNGDSILYYVMKTVTVTSSMTGFSMNNIKVLDNGVIQWLPYGTNTVFNTDDYLECTITCTDAYNNTKTDVIIIYNSEEEPDDPGPDDPGPDDPGEI